jgi:hypothetical protein
MGINDIKRLRKKGTRYRTEDDGEDDSVPLAPKPPGMCAVFVEPDEDEADPEYIKAADVEKKRAIGKLRALNLNVDEHRTEDGTKTFLTITAPETLLRYEAEAHTYQLRLQEEYGGALCAYTAELEAKDAFDTPKDKAHKLFCSAFQLKMIKDVVYSEAYQAEPGEEEDVIDFDKLMNPEDPSMKIVEAYFPLHHDRVRLQLLMEWARPMDKPQPLELVREYFGEKMALFYTWFGFYNTMLWIPAIAGFLLFVTQILSYSQTGSLENPYSVVYACVIALWSNTFCSLWKQLENTRKYQWDMLAFEDLEDLREEFKDNPKTITSEEGGECDPHINEVTEEVDEYWYDDGQYFPIPTGRAKDQLITYTVVLVVIIIVIVAFQFFWVHVTHPLMEPGNVLVGGVLGGVLNSVVTIAFDIAMDGIAELELPGITGMLVEGENWTTDTEHEDAIIKKTFYFKFFSKYYALLMVAFGVNYLEIDGEVHKCPDFQCLPVLQCMFCTIVVIDIVYQLVVQHLFPIINKWIDAMNEPAGARAEAGRRPKPKTPQEEQYDWLDSTPTVDLYKDKIYQFGYISMFGVVFPLVVPLCLLVNLIEMRTRATTLLTKNRRPEPLSAADIGSYQYVLEVCRVSRREPACIAQAFYRLVPLLLLLPLRRLDVPTLLAVASSTSWAARMIDPAMITERREYSS